MQQLTQQELEMVAGERWEQHAKNTIFNAFTGAGIGLALGGPAGAVIGFHYGAVGYAIFAGVDAAKSKKKR